jgi:GDPmannose 4,6-dehydratase
LAFAHVGITLDFKGSGINEIGVVVSCANKTYQLPIGKVVVGIDARYFRPAEVDLLIGDASKAKEKLGWTPTHTLQTLVDDMMASELLNTK